MIRILLGVVLLVVGLAGLVLSFCGSLFMSYSRQNGGLQRDENLLAVVVIGVGVLMILGSIIGIVKVVRWRRTPSVRTGSVHGADDLPL